MLLLVAENGEEQRFQSSMPMNDGERGEETSSFKPSEMLNDILAVSRGLIGSVRASHANDIGELWLSKVKESRSYSQLFSLSTVE
jgi:hypothetical protein